MWPYHRLLNPRRWQRVYRGVRFLMIYGPDFTTVITRDLPAEDWLQAAVKNWANETEVLLPHRYRQLVKGLQKEGAVLSEFDSTWHNLAAPLLIWMRMFAKTMPTPVRISIGDVLPSDGLIWELHPEMSDKASPELQSRIRQFGRELAQAAQFAEEAMLWSIRLKEHKPAKG